MQDHLDIFDLQPLAPLSQQVSWWAWVLLGFWCFALLLWRRASEPHRQLKYSLSATEQIQITLNQIAASLSMNRSPRDALHHAALAVKRFLESETQLPLEEFDRAGLRRLAEDPDHIQLSPLYRELARIDEERFSPTLPRERVESLISGLRAAIARFRAVTLEDRKG